tara:strand:+ start:414 stop:707 length:294 start_codon:yes stop_codon:yes gene_type:complete
MDEVTSPKKALVLYLIPVVFLMYFVAGAFTGEISFPGRTGIHGLSAWLACGFPVLWLASKAIRHEPKINLEDNTRTVLAPIIMAVGVGIFFYIIYEV